VLRHARLIVPERRKLDPLVRYLTAFACRRELLLGHFGEHAGRCGRCDRCARWDRLWGRAVLRRAS